MDKVAVLGIGNLLLKDDGIGIHVIEHLIELGYDSIYNVELIDGGTCILDLLDVFVKNKKVIVLDSIKGGHMPGTIYKLTPQELGTYIKSTTSLHDVQILDILRDVELLGANPEVIIIGIEPEEITFDLELSTIIKESIPKITDIVKEELNRS